MGDGEAPGYMKKPGDNLLSRPARTDIIGAGGLTAVFGMGTGVALSL